MATFLLMAGSFLLGACTGVVLTCLVQCTRVRERTEARLHERR